MESHRSHNAEKCNLIVLNGNVASTVMSSPEYYVAVFVVTKCDCGLTCCLSNPLALASFITILFSLCGRAVVLCVRFCGCRRVRACKYLLMPSVFFFL